MTDLTLDVARCDPRDPRFAAALDAQGRRHWADPAFPYDLAGAGTAAGMGAASAIELPIEEEGEAPPTPPAAEPLGVSGSAFVFAGPEAGAAGVLVRPGYLRGEVVPVALLRDLAPPRDGQAARRLIAAALDFAREHGAVVAVAASPGPDAPLADLTTGWDGVPAFVRVGELRAIRVVPALWRWEEPEYKVLVATRTEIPALAYLLDADRQGLAFAPPVDEASFVRGVERCPNLKIGDFRLARFKGDLAAMCGVWEPGEALPVALRRPSPAEAVMSLAGKVLGRLSPSPRLPGAGQPLRVRFVRSFAAKQGHPHVLRYLLDRIANETRKSGAHAFEIVLPAGDPQLDAVVGRSRRVRSPSVWAAPLRSDMGLADLGPIDAGILDPGF